MKEMEVNVENGDKSQKLHKKKKETLAKYSWNEFQKVEGGEESENAKINIGKEEKVC